MADLMLLVDTAVTVPVNLLPLIDDTDFKTRETAIAHNAAGMDLVWNFITAAGVITQTAVTPTTGGDYDWTHVGDAIYKIEIPASGGANINNDTEGFGWFSGFVTGVLPWRGPVIQFSPANIVNSLVTGTDKLQVHADEITNGLITAAAIADGAIDAGAIADGAIDAATFAANAITATAIAADAITAAKLAADVTTELQSGLATAAALTTIDDFLDTEIAAIKAVTDALPDAGALTTIQADLDNIQTRLPAALVGGRMDSSTGAMAAGVLTATAIAADAITAAKLAADVTTELQSGLATAAALDAVDNFLDTEIAAIKAVTDLLPDAGALTTIQADLDNIQTRLPAALVAGRIDASVGAMAADTLTAAALAADALAEIQSGLATAANLATVAGYIDTEVAAIKAVTDLLPNGGALTSLATAAALTTIDDFLDTEIAAIKAVTDALPNAGALTTIQADLDNIQTRLPAALVGGKIDAAVASVDALGAQAKLDVNAEVKDVLEVDTHVELAVMPSKTAPTKLNMMQFVYQWFRFHKSQNASELEMYKADDTTVLGTQTVTDDTITTVISAGV